MKWPNLKLIITCLSIPINASTISHEHDSIIRNVETQIVLLEPSFSTDLLELTVNVLKGTPILRNEPFLQIDALLSIYKDVLTSGEAKPFPSPNRLSSLLYQYFQLSNVPSKRIISFFSLLIISINSKEICPAENVRLTSSSSREVLINKYVPSSSEIRNIASNISRFFREIQDINQEEAHYIFQFYNSLVPSEHKLCIMAYSIVPLCYRYCFGDLIKSYERESPTAAVEAAYKSPYRIEDIHIYFLLNPIFKMKNLSLEDKIKYRFKTLLLHLHSKTDFLGNDFYICESKEQEFPITIISYMIPDYGFLSSRNLRSYIVLDAKDSSKGLFLHCGIILSTATQFKYYIGRNGDLIIANDEKSESLTMDKKWLNVIKNSNVYHGSVRLQTNVDTLHFDVYSSPDI